MKLKSHRWWDHTTRDFAALDMEKIVAVLPVGAVEQHGPHLPVKVDAAINAAIVEAALQRMPADLPVLVLPMMPVGKSNEHLAFPGTLTLSHQTLLSLWLDICESVARTGCRKIIVFNSHGGQPQVIDILCREMRVRHGVFAVNAMWARMTNLGDLYDAAERRHGIHAGEVETSVMMHIDGDFVDLKHAANFEPLSVSLEASGGLLMPEGAGVGFGWQMQDLHPSGAAGNAAAADAQRGATTLARAADAFVKLCEEMIAYPLERIVKTTAYSDV
jgi:creatinine amidohydrolase